MSNKKQIDRVHKIFSVALQGDTEYIKQKLERNFNLQISQEYFPSRRELQWSVISGNFHTAVQNNAQFKNYLTNAGRNIKIKAHICIHSTIAYNCLVLKEEKPHF